jgi:hypothetical protein
MEYQHYMQIYFNYSNKQITLQEYIDWIINYTENNRVKQYLKNFLNATIELENHFQIRPFLFYRHKQENQFQSHRFSIYANDDQIYYYYISKHPCLGHYCLYISIPTDHALHGEHYDEVPFATYSNIDNADITRWVFGWDYANFNDCTSSIINLLAFNQNQELLDKRVITIELLENDANRYIEYFEENF